MAERVAAVIGHPIAHSLSPALFAEFARAADLDLDYRAVDVRPDALGETLGRWRADARFVGCNVTMPHKKRIITFLDSCSDAARSCDAVNVVRRDGSRLVGENTDLVGITVSLRTVGFEPSGRDAVVLGAGGAAQAVVCVLAEAKARAIAIVARNAERARSLVSRAARQYPGTRFSAVALGAEVPAAAIYVNATPLGQSGQPYRSLLPPNTPADAVAFDLVYRPAKTPFLQESTARGLRTIGGFTMLLEQALATFEAWFSFRPPLD
ncbi:MAG: shikimate dehydrogenase family protein, partial [Polyangiaceae bacterium]